MTKGGQKTYMFHVTGMHCASCAVMIESGLKELRQVAKATVGLKESSLEVTGDFGDADTDTVRDMLAARIKAHGYDLSSKKEKGVVAWGSFTYALPIASAFIAFFIFLQKAGIVSLITADKVTYGTAFVVGLIASVSTCMAVVGGLALSVSANFAKEGSSVMPPMFFHAGRLVSFFMLGAIIGALGSMFQLDVVGTALIDMFVGLVLLALGLNLLDVFPWLKGLQPTLPRFLSAYMLKVREVNHTLTPFFVGALTFFLPCGFTQSMQLYSLASGSAVTGAFTMFSFALGTLPVLSLLSFTSAGIHDKKKAEVFFRTAGIVVVFFAGMTLLTSASALGIMPPLINF